MSDFIGTTQQVSEHLCIESRFGSDNPGWFLSCGFRASGRVPFEGPYSTKEAALRACIWFAALLLPTYRDAKMGLFTPVIAVKDEVIHVGSKVRVDSFVKLEGGEGMLIGNHVHIASFCHLGIGGGLTLLEDGSSFGSGAKVISGTNVAGIGHGCSAVAPDAIFQRSFAHIKKNATLYAGAIVTPGVTVGENAVLAAGSVATHDIPDGEIWAGVPARFLRKLS